MSNTYESLNALFTATADAIRAKDGTTEPIVADNFPTRIQAISSGGDYNYRRV